jgi:hypothetical protein
LVDAPAFMAGHMAQLDLLTEYSGRSPYQGYATTQGTVRDAKALIRITGIGHPQRTANGALSRGNGRL